MIAQAPRHIRTCRAASKHSPLTARAGARFRRSGGLVIDPCCPVMATAGSWALACLGWLVKTVVMASPEPADMRWPAHLPVGALRVVRWSPRYEQTVVFYRDIIGLPVLETFENSYGLDGTILGLPGGPVHLEIVRS